MERLTTNKPVSEMGMYELTHNSCYIAEDGNARYRDFNTDIDAREFVRNLMTKYGHWKSCEEYGPDADNELIDDDIFDDTMLENLMYDTGESTGLIALFYRNLWAMAELRETLKAYEDSEEQGLLLRLPFKIGQKVYYIYESCIDGSLMIGSMCYGYSCLDFPRTYYATKEEAEQKLAEMKEV